MTKEEFLKYVEISFISDDKKKKIFDMAEKDGVTDEVFDFFNDCLVEGINEKGDKFENTINEFEKLESEIKKDYDVKEKQFENDLDLEIQKADTFDLREKAMDKYYNNLKILRESYLSQLKNILSAVTVTAIKNNV